MRLCFWNRLLFVLPAILSLGASCNGGSSPATLAQDKPAASAKAQQIEKLEPVSTSDLTDTERRLWVELVNAQLSPCGEPISVAQCVAEGRGCRSCVPAARYLVRLVAEGYQKGEIESFYADRYDDKKKVVIETADAPLKGAAMGRASIVEFSDFECPYCGAAHPLLSSVLAELDGKVSLAFKHYPLDGHKNAQPAARAAVAAQLQGKFWELADRLFEHQRELSPEKIRQLAEEAGLDMTRFDADLASEAVQQRVDRDKKDGAALDIQGTPTLFVNGRRYHEPLSNLTKYLKEELEM